MQERRCLMIERISGVAPLKGQVLGYAEGNRLQIAVFDLKKHQGLSHNNGWRRGRFRNTSSFVGFASSLFHTSTYFGWSYASPANSSAGDRTGQNSQYITSGLYGHFDLSLM